MQVKNKTKIIRKEKKEEDFNIQSCLYLYQVNFTSPKWL